MKIETIKIKNFKSLKEVELRDLPQYCVFLGRNGVGKTTLFKVFAFIKNCLESNVRSALELEGGLNGFKEVITRGANPEKETIDLEIQFRMEIASKQRLVTYLLQIGLSRTSQPIVKREILRYKRGRSGKPFHFLDFSSGIGYAIANEEDFDKPDEELERENEKLATEDTLAIKGLGQFERFKAAKAFRELLEQWHVSDFHIGDARGGKKDSGSIHLSASGDNLPAVARHLYEQHPERFDLIKQKMRDRVPGVEDIEVKVMDDGRLIIRYKDGAFIDPFFDKNVSDGTIKMFAYLILLHDPLPHLILCVEEPENQLYPELMSVLAEEFQEYANQGGQVFVSTHSPQFLNAVELPQLYVIEKVDGVSQVYRASKDPLLSEQVEAGWKLGTLWERGTMKGLGERIVNTNKIG